MSFSERRYLDPWDVENYIYLRKGPVRRRSVCFDQAVKYASYEDDGFGPIYGSLVETNLKSGSNDYPDDFNLYSNNSSPTLSHCPSCLRALSDYSSSSASDGTYEDPLAQAQMERRRRKKRAGQSTTNLSSASSGRIGMNTFGHLRIDYSTNWNKLDRYVGHS